MYRTVTIVSLCVLVAVLVALIVANSRTQEVQQLTTESSRLESGDILTRARNETSENPEIFNTFNVTSEESNQNITENDDIISEATDFVTHSNISQIVQEHNNSFSGIVEEKKKTLEKIQEEVKEAEINLKEKEKRLKEINQRALATKKLSEETQQQFEMIIAAMNSLQDSIIQSSKASTEAFWQLQLQTSKYNDAKRKYSKLASELDLSRSDYKQMKEAVDTASAAVRIAMDNMDRSAFKF